MVAYAVLDPDQPARVPNDANFDWPDGMPRPAFTNNMGNFVWNEVRIFRRDYGFTVGYQAIEAAQGWNPKAFFNAIILQQAMTNVTQRFITLMETAANWSGSTADVNTLNGGKGAWDQASDDPNSSHYLAIQKSVLEAARRITLATNGMIGFKDLILVVSPGLAEAMANSSEIHNYLAKQERSIRVLEGKEPDVTAVWGLPETFCGIKVVVEDAVIVKEYPNTSGTTATVNRVFCKSDTSAVLCTRVGGIDGNYGSPSASTFQRYFYKYEMAVEAFDEPKHKLFESHVVDQFMEILAAPRSGYLLTGTL